MRLQWGQKPSAAPEAPPAPVAQPQPEAPRPPANELEATVEQAPSVVSELQKTEAQKRQEALATMDMLEAARAEKGNFCVTLGKGEYRALLLVAPTETTASQSYYGQPEITKIVSDYYLLTAKGIRRIRLDKDGESQKALQHAVDSIVKKQGFLEDSSFTEGPLGEGKTRYSLNIPVKDRNTAFFLNFDETRYEENEFATITDRKIDPDAPRQALERSLEAVQSPIRAQIEGTRAQIQAINNLRAG